jgi:DNA adenine methylase
MKPLISYYGGKQRLAKRIVEHIDRIPHTVYVEPFAGGAAVLFAKPRREVTNKNYYREVLNDKSDILINLYRCAIEHPEELALKLEATLYSQSDHKRAASILEKPSSFSALEVAWAYYFKANSSFSNDLTGGWSISTLKENHADTWDRKVLSLPEKLGRLRSVYISSEDALRCIDRWDAPQTLFYIDPPYPEANQGHYGGYTAEDWILLCDKLDSIKGSYILSNYPQPYQPESAQQRLEIEATMSAAKVKNSDASRLATDQEIGDRKRTEVLWICDRSNNSDRPDIQKLLSAQRDGY